MMSWAYQMVAFTVSACTTKTTAGSPSGGQGQLFLQPLGRAPRATGVLVSAAWGGGKAGKAGTGGARRGQISLICSPKLVSLLLLPPFPLKHAYTEKFYLYVDRHTK